MISIIDNIISTTGWSASGGAYIHGLTGMSSFSAGNNDTSLIVKLDGIGSYVEKTYSKDISDYDEIILWINSRNLGKDSYRNPSDYSYKIDFGDGTKEFYLPVNSDFYYVRIKASFDTITRLRITALTDATDYLIISYFLVNKTILPLDIFQGVKEQIEYHIANNVSLKTLGVINGSTDDTGILFSAPVDFLDRYSVIKISDGSNSEIHGIIKREGNKYNFSGMYDGKTLLHDYTDATVNLYYPVEFGTNSKEIVFPSITVWGFTPERKMIVTDLDHIVDSVKTDNTFQERQVGQHLNWLLLIDCTAKEEWELLGELSEIVRKVIGKKIVWVNGRKCYINFESAPVLQEPNDAYDVIPQIQYSANIEVREELYDEVTLPATTSIDVEATIIEQGEING